jgi:hypothetical protein
MKKENPFGQFLSKLPKKASILGCRGRRTDRSQEFRIAYYYRGVVYNQMFSMEGGTL